MIHIALLALVTAGAAPGQQDGRWLAFEGCWVAEGAGAVDAPDHMVCIRRVGGAAVFETWVDGALQSEQVLQADGTARPLAEGGCEGTEVGQWSADGRRVFVRQEMMCAAAPRSATTVLAFVSGSAFADVRALRVGTETSVRSIRYRAVDPALYPAGFALAEGQDLARETARLHAAAALEPADVIEASRLVEADAVNGLLAVRRAGFNLSAATLKQLRSSGVAPSTLDVMIALTYPERFAVAAEPPAGEQQPRWEPQRALRPDLYYDPYDPYDRYRGLGLYDRFMNCRSFGYLSSYGCYAYNPYLYNYGTGGVWVVPVDPGTGVPRVTRSGSVSADGYRRGASGSRGTAAPRSGDGGSSMPARAVQSGSSGSSGSAGSSGSGSVSSGGHSSGGSESKGTAKPRGGGEGGQ